MGAVQLAAVEAGSEKALLCKVHSMSGYHWIQGTVIKTVLSEPWENNGIHI